MLKKKHRSYNFFPGDKVAIIYNEQNIIKEYKGKLSFLAADGVYLSSFKKDTTLQYIPDSLITSVHLLLRSKRLTSGITAGVSLAATILFAIAANTTIQNGAKDNYAGFFAIVLGTVAVSSGVYFLSTFVSEQLNTKSVKRGWHFSVE